MSCKKTGTCGTGCDKAALKAKRVALRACRKAKLAANKRRLKGLVKNITGCGLALALAGVMCACSTATPTSKQARTKACDNTTTVNNYIGILPGMTNGIACAGGITITLSDLNGSILQSADGDGNNEQTATPTMAAGITGDAPMQAMADAAAAFASPQGALDAAVQAIAAKFGWGTVAATNAAEAGTE